MFKWLFGKRDKTCYLVCFVMIGAKTGLKTFTLYNALMPLYLGVKEDSFRWQQGASNYIKGWVWVEDKADKKDIIRRLENEPKATYLSEGKSKKSFKSQFKWGI